MIEFPRVIGLPLAGLVYILSGLALVRREEWTRAEPVELTAVACVASVAWWRRAGPADTKKTVMEGNRVADVLSVLTSFETYDALARAGHTEEEIFATITILFRCISGL